MKLLRMLSRNIRDSFKSVFRNFALSLASISCITITLIVVAISIILSLNVNNFASLVEKDVTIVTFLENQITEEQKAVVKETIESLDNVESYEFTSKKDITEEMIESSETWKNIMTNWSEEENPIQDTYQVKVKDINKISKTAKEIEGIKGVSIVKYGEGMVEQLVTVFDTVRKICIGMVIALILVTAFLISNTIKITIVARKREIDIMRLVGASNINIKIPFIFEGLFLGALGSIIPIIATVVGYDTLYEHFNGQLFSPFIQLVKPSPFTFYVSLVLLVIGILVGMFGSWRAVRKHLKI